MHILVDGSSLGALGGAARQAGGPMPNDPPGYTVAQLEDYHLRQCYYAALAQGSKFRPLAYKATYGEVG